MPRKGWSVMPTPAGWFEVIRGPRPPSVQWPPAKGKGKTEYPVQAVARGRWQHGQTQVGRWKRGRDHIASTQSSWKVRSLDAALAALGPEESPGKTEITVALQRAREQNTPQVRFDPEARVAAGRARVARLEQAISALGDMKGPPMDVALRRSQQDAQEMPLETQIQAREAFLERARKRIAHFDQGRAAEFLRMQECVCLLEELRALRDAQQVKPSPPVETSGEVARLQQMVFDLQRQLQQSGPRFHQSLLRIAFRRGRGSYPQQTRSSWSGWQTRGDARRIDVRESKRSSTFFQESSPTPPGVSNQ